MKKFLISLLLTLMLSTAVSAEVVGDKWSIDGGAYQTNPIGSDLGTAANPLGDIYAGSLFVSGITLTGNLHFNDDVGTTFGNTAGSPDFIMGVLSTDSDNLHISRGGTLGTNTILRYLAASDTVQIDGVVDMNSTLNWSTGTAATAGSYQITRNADSPNRLQYEVPTGAIHEFSINDSLVAFFGSSGIGTLSIFNQSTGTNSQLALGANGSTISRNIADANPALVVEQINAGSTGDIFRLENDVGPLLTVSHAGVLTVLEENGASVGISHDAVDGSIVTSTGNLALDPAGIISLGKAINSAQGTDIASASTIVIPTDGNTFELTGTTPVTLITTTGYEDGHRIKLICNENVTITNGTATAGSDVTIVLADNANFDCTAQESLVLELQTTTADGQFWGEEAKPSAGASAEMATIAGSTFSTVQHMQDIYHSAGWVSGGGITDDADGTITVAAGTGLIRATDGQTAEILFFDWASEAGANVALVDNDTSYVYVEYNAGSPRVIATTTERTDFNTNVLLATIYREGTSLHINDADKFTVGDHASLMIRRLKDTLAYGRKTGGILSAPAGVKIAITAGDFWRGLTEFSTSAVDTNAAGTFSYYYKPAGAWTKVTTQSDIDNAQYNDFGTGLATLSNNKYGVHWVYLEVDDDDISVIYGIGDYTLDEAKDAQPPSSVPEHLNVEGILAGKIIIKKSDAAFSQIESAFQTTFQGSLATDHGSLAGLADDDHTQYLLADGTRALAGSWDMGSQDITNIDVDSGTIDGVVIGAASALAGNFAALGATGLATLVDLIATTARTTTDMIALNGNTLTTGNLIFGQNIITADGLANRGAGNNLIDYLISRTESRTSGTTVDDYDLMSLVRTSITTGAGGTMTEAGSVLKLENVATQTAGTLTDTVAVLELVADVTGTGPHISFNTQSNGSPRNTEGDFWYDGTSLNFRDGATTTDLLAGGGGDLVVFVSAGDFLPEASSSVSNADTANTGSVPMVEFLDAVASGRNSVSVKVPAGATTLSKVEFLYENATSSADIHFISLAFRVIRAGAADSSDNGSNVVITSGATTGRPELLAVAAAAFNGLSIQADDVIGFDIDRDSDNAADNYNTTWTVYGVYFTFT